MKRFLKNEDAFLRFNYKQMTTRELADALHRTVHSVNQRLSRLKLLRPKECIKHPINSGCFKKGLIPWNKGKTGIHVSPSTEFKPGHLPATTLYDGCIRIRVHTRTGVPYKHIRVAKGKWETLHRYNYEKRYGPIPKSHLVRFKDGDTLNCEPENLYLLSKADNARRNTNRKKAAIGIKIAWDNNKHLESDKWIAFTLAPNDTELRKIVLRNPELIELKRSQLKLKRTVKRIQQGEQQACKLNSA